MKLFDTDYLFADLKGRSVRGGVASLGAQMGDLVLQLGSTVGLARLLTPRDYGIFGMATVVTGFLGLFQDMGLSVATIQRERITHREVTALFWLNAAVGLGIAPASPISGLLLAAAAAAPAALLALWATRSGRRTLRDGFSSLADLRRPSPAPREEEATVG